MIEFTLKNLRENIHKYAAKENLGIEFVKQVGEKVKSATDLDTLKAEILALFVAKGTTFYQASHEIIRRIPSNTHPEKKKLLENEPLENEIRKVYQDIKKAEEKLDIEKKD